MDRASQTGICNKMALKLTVELCNGGSYLCGEKLHCRVHFTNESTSDGQVVAWCGAQLHCQCTFREDLVNPPSPPSGGLPRTQTSFLPSSGTLTRVVYALRGSCFHYSLFRCIMCKADQGDFPMHLCMNAS